MEAYNRNEGNREMTKPQLTAYQLRDRYVDQFQKTFGVSLRQFWDKLFGFDVFKFDEFIKSPDGESIKQCVRDQYGEAAADMITTLLGRMPIQDILERDSGKENPSCPTR